MNDYHQKLCELVISISTNTTLTIRSASMIYALPACAARRRSESARAAHRLSYDMNMMEIPGVQVPIVLGHEGAGVVAEVGPGVTEWAVGDAGDDRHADAMRGMPRMPARHARQLRYQSGLCLRQSVHVGTASPRARPSFSFAGETVVKAS